MKKVETGLDDAGTNFNALDESQQCFDHDRAQRRRDRRRLPEPDVNGPPPHPAPGVAIERPTIVAHETGTIKSIPLLPIAKLDGRSRTYARRSVEDASNQPKTRGFAK